MNGDYIGGLGEILASNRTPDTRDLVVATASSRAGLQIRGDM